MRELKECEAGEAYLSPQKLKLNRIKVTGTQSNTKMASTVEGGSLTVSLFDYISFIMQPECKEERIFGKTLSFKLNDEYVTAEPYRLQADIIDISLKLKSLGKSPFEASWFYYDSNFIGDEGDRRHSFFLAQDKEILIEDALVTEEVGEGFSFELWKVFDWEIDQNWALALNRYWYRKFYTETLMGQVFVLQPNTQTHYFPLIEPRTPTEFEMAIVSKLEKIESVLKIAILIMGVSLIKAFF